MLPKNISKLKKYIYFCVHWTKNPGNPEKNMNSKRTVGVGEKTKSRFGFSGSALVKINPCNQKKSRLRKYTFVVIEQPIPIILKK